jgi:hypothetical protein
MIIVAILSGAEKERATHGQCRPARGARVPRRVAVVVESSGSGAAGVDGGRPFWLRSGGRG